MSFKVTSNPSHSTCCHPPWPGWREQGWSGGFGGFWGCGGSQNPGTQREAGWAGRGCHLLGTDPHSRAQSIPERGAGAAPRGSPSPPGGVTTVPGSGGTIPGG